MYVLSLPPLLLLSLAGSAAAQTGPEVATDAHGRRAVAPPVDATAPIGGVAQGLAVDPAWTALGPYGGDVADVAVNPADESVVLAGLAPSTGAGTLFRSTDAGATWTEVPSLAGQSVYDLEFDAAGNAYAGTLDGPWRSVDGGATWTQLSLGIGLNDQTLEITLDPGTLGRIWVGVAGALGGQTQNVLFSDTGGATWTNATPPGAAGTSCTGIAIDPTDSSTVFACFGGAFGGGSVWRSTTAGASWTNVSAGLPANPMNDLHYDGTRVLVVGGLLFGSQPVGLYASSTDGASWTPLHDATWPQLVIQDVEVDPADASRIYVASAGSGVFRSIDGGATWTFGFGGTDGLSVNEVETSPSGGAPLYAGNSSAAVWKSADGASFAPSSTGIGSLNAYSVAANPLDPDELAVAFQGQNDGGVFTSVDGGLSWSLEPLPGTRFNTVVFAPDGTLHAISDGPTSVAPEGVYRRGPTGWTSIGPDQGTLFESELTPLVFSANDPDLILTAGNDFGVAGFEPTIWRSTNGGETWVKEYEGAASNESVTGVAILSGGTDLVQVASFNDLGAQTGGALRSTDGGDSWVDASAGLAPGTQGSSVSASPFAPNLVVLADDAFGAGGLWLSIDAGQSWSPAGYASQTFQAFFDPLRPTRILVAQKFGGPKAGRSEDLGATVQAFDQGLASSGGLNGAALDPGPCSRLLLATTTGAYARTASCGLEGDVATVSASAGGTQNLSLAGGPDALGALYWVVGSASGTEPGFTLAGVHVPLNFDFYFNLSLTHPNQAPFVNSFGLLNAFGLGNASFVAPPGVGVAFVGTTFHHAFGAFYVTPALQVVGASNAEAVTIVP